MLLPTLNALAFLHSKNLVHGRLKPSNILAVKDQLKLASDTVRPAGESTANTATSSVYDPPEAKDGSCSAAGDIWALGITMVEALTQHLPSWPDGKSESASFPAALPPRFAEIVRLPCQCLKVPFRNLRFPYQCLKPPFRNLSLPSRSLTLPCWYPTSRSRPYRSQSSRLLCLPNAKCRTGPLLQRSRRNSAGSSRRSPCSSS
jgi:serine/threonine protein kinase